MVWDLDGGSFFTIMNECLFKHHRLKRLSFPHWIAFASLLKINWPIFVWVSSGESLDFDCTIRYWNSLLLAFSPLKLLPMISWQGPSSPHCWVPRTVRMDCFSTSFRSWSLALVGFGINEPTNVPELAGSPNRVFQEVLYIKAHSPPWPIDPHAQGTLQLWPSWWAQSSLTSTHPSTPPPILTCP